MFGQVTTRAEVTQLNKPKAAYPVPNVSLVQAPSVNLCHTGQGERSYLSINVNVTQHWLFRCMYLLQSL